MYRVGICGHYGGGKIYLDGQTVKTKIFTKELANKIGEQNIQIVDTHGWKRNPLSLIIKCIMLLSRCQNIIIFPDQNGIKVLSLLFVILNRVFNRKLHYVVIGGWLPELLEKNSVLKNRVSKFDGVYVETYSMLKELEKLGFTNVEYLPNFKQLNILNKEELIFQNEEPYKLCTFSRVVYEKGIEDAIEAVKNVNDSLGRIVYTLDIYGQVDEKYRDRFENLKNTFPEYIAYKGVVDYNRSVDVLKKYFALLFPTHYRTEGMPGTIIDAYAAGIPVISSHWNSATEIIINGETGFVYDFKSRKGLEKVLFNMHSNIDQINEMKKNCLRMAKQYTPEVAIGLFLNYLN